MVRKYDAIVVGGGVAGAAIGALLAKRGRKTLLVEKEAALGGRSSTFSYFGYRIDTGSHQVASFSSSGMKPLFEEVGASIDLVPIRPSLMNFNVSTREYTRATSPQRLKENYEDYKKLRKIISTMPKEEIDRTHDINAETWLRKNIKGEGLMDFFRRITGFAGLSVKEASAGAFLETLKDAFTAEMTIAYLKEGGFIRYTEALAQSMERNGGEILTGVEVTSIGIDGNGVTGIKTRKNFAGGEMIAESEAEAPLIVLTVPVNKVFKLVPKEKCHHEFVARVEEVQRDSRVYGGLLVGVKEDLLLGFGGGEQFFQFTAGRAGEEWHALITVPTSIDRSLAPKGYHYMICNSHHMLPLSQGSEIPEHHQRCLTLLREIFPNFDTQVDWLARVTYFDTLFPPRPKRTGPFRPGNASMGLKGLYLGGDGAYLSGSGVGSAIKSAWMVMEQIERGI